MREEVHCACEFFSKMMESKHLPHQFATQFRLRLEELLSQRFKDHWDTRNPSKGSAYRCIRINSKMDPVVSEAAKVTGLKDISKYLPAEFTMWIDPRDVSYRFGEDGSICSCPLDFMVTRSEWSQTPSSHTATVSNSLAPGRYHHHHHHHYNQQQQQQHHQQQQQQLPFRSRSSPSSMSTTLSPLSSPPSSSSTSPSSSQSNPSNYYQVYRNLSSRLIQVQV